MNSTPEKEKVQKDVYTFTDENSEDDNVTLKPDPSEASGNFAEVLVQENKEIKAKQNFYNDTWNGFESINVCAILIINRKSPTHIHGRWDDLGTGSSGVNDNYGGFG